MKKVVVTKKLPIDINPYLEGFRIEMNSAAEALPLLRLRQMTSDADAIIASSSDIIDKTLMDSASKLKVIANYSTTYSNIDIEYAHKKGITVCLAGNTLTQNTAELIFSLLMSVAKKIPYEDASARNGNIGIYEGKKTFEFYKKTLGILGMDMIGQAVAKISSGFSMDVIYNDIKRKYVSELLLGATSANFNEILEWSDFIIISNIFDTFVGEKINISHFKRMKRNTILLCLNADKTFEKKDLITALKDNLIGGVALNMGDFTEEEQSILKNLNNTVLITNERDGSAQKAPIEMAIICAKSVASVLKDGITPETAITI